MRAYLLDVENKRKQVVEIDDNRHLEEYYKYLNCSVIDITNRKVGGKWFDIIVDDEGMLKENPIVSALDSDMQPALVGNLLFCNWDGETGEEISLSDDDIKHLEKYTALAVQKDAEGRELDCLLVVTKVDFE